MNTKMNVIKCTVVIIFIILSACDEDMPPEQNSTPSQEPTAETHDYLSLENATVIIGTYPTAPNGDLKINFKDTLYLMNGNPYKGRVSVLHVEALDVSGFYIWVEGSEGSTYYDVPAVEKERKDTVDVFYVGFEPPVNQLQPPYTIQVKIQPHQQDGTSLDEFTRYLTVEEPQTEGIGPGRVAGSTCEITTSFDRWRWLYTEMFINGALFQITAPWFSATYSESGGNSGYYYGKCCIYDPDYGLIEVYEGDPTRGELICEFGNPYYKRVFISTPFSLKAYDELFLFKDGKFRQYTAALVVNFIPQKSRICDLFAYYERKFTAYERNGTHDYVPGAKSLKLTLETSVPSFGPVLPSGNFVNTCHLLIFSTGGTEKYTIVYQKLKENTDTELPDPMSYVDAWFS